MSDARPDMHRAHLICETTFHVKSAVADAFGIYRFEDIDYITLGTDAKVQNRIFFKDGCTVTFVDHDQCRQIAWAWDRFLADGSALMSEPCQPETVSAEHIFPGHESCATEGAILQTQAENGNPEADPGD